MANITPTVEEIVTRGDDGHIITWGPMTAGDTGLPISMIGSARRTIQVVGSFAGIDRLLIEGSIDSQNYSPLTDNHGNKLEFKGAGLSSISDLTRLIRPRVSAGAPTAVKVTLLVRKEFR